MRNLDIDTNIQVYNCTINVLWLRNNNMLRYLYLYLLRTVVPHIKKI